MTSLMTLIAKTEQRDSEIKELQEQVKEMTALVQQLAESNQRDRDSAEHARQVAQLQHELLVSRLQTKLLTYERGLPPPAGADDVL